MTRKSLFAIGLVAATVLAATAYADSRHGHGRGLGQGMMNQQGDFSMMGGSGMMGGPGMMGGGQFGGPDDMMQMMTHMHGPMMGGGMMGAMGPAGSFMPGGMGTMMGAFDADGDANVTPDELRAGLEARHAEFDADGDGSLALAEFEALHGALIRETMVDRFQALDNDGDGLVTKEEMAAPAERMEAMLQMRARMFDDAAGQQPTGAGTNGGQAPMMENN